MIYSEISSNKRKTALLITFFLVLIIALGYVFSLYANQPLLLPIAVGISVAMSFFSYFFSDKIVLAMSQAHEIQRADDEDLYPTVENLPIAAAFPTPKLFLFPHTAPTPLPQVTDPH